MLDPQTGIRLGEEVDMLREENGRLRAALEVAREYVPRAAVVTLKLCDAALRGEGE